MKFLRYGEPGHEKPGILDKDGKIRDLSVIVSDLRGRILEYLPVLRGLDLAALPAIEGDVRLGPPVAGTGKMICVGLNYADHAAESGMDVPSEPVIFMKATSAICGPNDPIIVPRNSEKTDWEVELAVVIGRKARHVSRTEVMGHIAGFMISNDVSERDFQIERQGQWTKGKCCDHFGQIGPWLVTPDEIADPQNLKMQLSVNGEVKQAGSTATMVYGVKYLVSYLSGCMTLYPGDIISTGTPPGVGMGQKPPRYLRAGDRVELSVEGLGSQQQEVVDE